MARLKPTDEKKLRALASLDAKIAAELERHDQLTARLSDFLTQQKAENRKARNRELMIIASCVLSEAENNERFKSGLNELLNRHVSRQADRKFLILRGWEIKNHENENSVSDTLNSAE